MIGNGHENDCKSVDVRSLHFRVISLTIATLLCIQCALAGGSISWDDVKSRISKSDPELVKIIETSFAVERVGVGVRLGPHFGERQGERIAPYEFGADDRKNKVKCVLVIEESEDYEYTGRYKFTKRPTEVKKQSDVSGGNGG